MSKIAGLLLLLLGLGTIYFGYTEKTHLVALTKMAADSTITLGMLLCLAGLLHFRAPHKAFLFSTVLLLAAQAMAYIDLTFKISAGQWKYQAAFAVISVAILALSYAGYVSRKKQQQAVPV